ncbi:MAG: hypothetical protein KKG76_06885, partial [Euryarchaeota archaeon]|nr:hypothetical protein [Euryarchaeota archaeon]
TQKVGKFIKLDFTDEGFSFTRITETIESISRKRYYRKVTIEGQKAIDVINCFDLESEFEKVSCLNSV